MIILMFVTAFMLSGIAAWYAIAGLMAIFAAAALPIAIMGGTLEVSKLVVASWLYHNWKEVPKLLKSYFVIALFVLMSLTSMGIFGYLSKAHLDQAVPTGDVQAKISLIDEKINQEKEIINESRKTLNQLDQQVNETINRTASDQTDSGIKRSISIRKSQAKERKAIYEAISTAQTSISRLNEEKTPLSTQVRKIEAEVGPIKYIAQLIYGDQIDQTLLEKAVRIVILMIVTVFDPLAVLMLVAANWSLKRRKPKEEPKRDMSYYSDSKWTAEELEQANKDAIVDEAYAEFKKMEQDFINNQKPLDAESDKILHDNLWNLYESSEQATEDFFHEGKELAKAIDSNDGMFPKDWDPTLMKIYEGEDVIPSAPPPQAEKPIEYDSAGRRITPTK